MYDTPGYVYGYLLGKNVKYYLYQEDDGTSIAKYVEENKNFNNVVHIDAEDLIPGKTTLTSIYYKNDERKEKHIDFVTNIKVVYNGKLYKNFGYLSNVLPRNGYIEALDNNKDNKYEILFVSTYRNIIVSSVDDYAGTITAKGSTTPEKLGENAKFYLYPDMIKLELSKVRAGDVATIMESKGSSPLKTVYIVRDKVSGMITEYDSELGYQIKGVYYKKSADYIGPTLIPGVQATFCLDINGDLVDDDSSYLETDSSIGLMTGLGYEPNSSRGKIEVRIYTPQDAFEIYPVHFPIKVDGKTYKKENREDLLEVLSGNKKDSYGQYYIHDAYVIQYKLTGGEISSISTGTESGAGQLRKIAEGSSFFVRNEKMLGLESSPHTGYASYRPGKTMVFVCPSAGNLENIELYDMLAKLSSAREYIPSPTLYYQIEIDGYVMYDFNNNESKVAEVILLRGDGPLGGGVLTNSTPIGVVTKITTVVDQDGEKTQKIYTNGSETAILDQTYTYKKGDTTAPHNATYSYVEYEIEVEKAALYQLDAVIGVTANATAQFKIYVDGVEVEGILDVAPDSGSYTKRNATLHDSIPLAAGTRTLRIEQAELEAASLIYSLKLSESGEYVPPTIIDIDVTSPADKYDGEMRSDCVFYTVITLITVG